MARPHDLRPRGNCDMSSEREQAGQGPGENPSQVERVVLTLRAMLLRGEFRPGERLTELALVARLNASRTPVRLALERLSHQGLLEPMANGGFRARQFTRAEIWDAIEIRGVLEGTAARLAAERLASADELVELRQWAAEVEAIRPGGLECFVRYVETNVAFHRELWRLAKSSMLLQALEAVTSLPFAEPGALVFSASEDKLGLGSPLSAVAMEHHRAIVEAIENREGTRAEALAREHSRMARRNLDLMLGNPELLEQVPGSSLIAPEAVG
jgi:GntR family transcriptional regulator of vanillate catabolism